ncbi:MAG: energy transducer TonB [Methylococcales bacterium]|nr:energy transducer TonB [Methylococcales bacterium]
MNKKYTWLRRLPVLLGIGFTLLIVVAVFLLKDLFHKPPHTKKVVQQITMIQPPPPPPPPPEVKPPEPEVEEEKKEEPEPEQEPEPAPEESNEPPAEELGLDADGAAGSDGFGLAARKGGRSILGGSGGSSILWYGGQIKRLLEDELQALLADTPASKDSYAVVVNVWLGQNGNIERSELASGSGKPEVDQAIRAALPKLRLVLGKAPPENMPQPIKIRLTSRV